MFSWNFAEFGTGWW